MIRTFDSPIITNDQSIDRVLATGLPVLLVFYNNKLPDGFNTLLNQLAGQYSGRLLVAKISTKDNPAATGNYGIRLTPALVTLRNRQILTKQESITPGEVSQHAAFLLGIGPRPQVISTVNSSQARPTARSFNPSSTGHPIRVTDNTFDQEVLGSGNLVLVDFWAPWCGPCRMTDPIIEKLAVEMADRLKVAKVNVDENPRTAQRYDIRGIPAVMVVKNGKIIDQWVGAMPELAFRNRLAPLLAK